MTLRRMVSVFSLAFVAVLVSLAACTTPVPTGSLEAVANYWQPQGRVAGTGREVSLVTDGSTNIIAFAEEFGGTNYISVKRWTGTNWIYLGQYLNGSSAANSNASNPTLALDSSGNPVVAWSEFDGTVQNIYVQRFNGSSWVNVGTSLSGSSAASSYAFNPTLALDSSGNPVVAWQENGNIYVKRWTGSSWTPVGNVLDKVAANEALKPSLKLRTDGSRCFLARV
jgi:hypothetical protein